MEKKEYKTKTKACILAYLQQHKHRTIGTKEIFQHLAEQGLSVNLSTVYRNMDNLLNDGVVKKLQDIKGDAALYQYLEQGSGCREHLHIQCLTCGKLVHLGCGMEKNFAEHIKLHHEMELDLHASVLYGVCQSCKG